MNTLNNAFSAYLVELTKKSKTLLSNYKFNSFYLAFFYCFMFERHTIWKKRNSGWAEPWTLSEYMDKYRFTNVYRELDRGSQYFQREIKPFKDREKVNKIFLKKKLK